MSFLVSLTWILSSLPVWKQRRLVVWPGRTPSSERSTRTRILGVYPDYERLQKTRADCVHVLLTDLNLEDWSLEPFLQNLKGMPSRSSCSKFKCSLTRKQKRVRTRCLSLKFQWEMCKACVSESSWFNDSGSLRKCGWGAFCAGVQQHFSQLF